MNLKKTQVLLEFSDEEDARDFADTVSTRRGLKAGQALEYIGLTACGAVDVKRGKIGMRESSAKLCLEIKEGIDTSVKLEQRTDGKFRVIYGKQVEDNLGYYAAAGEFSLCVFHSLACAGKIHDGEVE